MSRYMQEICHALTRVLDHCARLERRRLAGYVGNLDFWISEIEHRLSLLDGYLERRRNMLAGTSDVYQDDIARHPDGSADSLTTPNVIDTSTNWDELNTEVAELRKQILASTRRFIMNCLETELIDRNHLFRIEDQLGVNLQSRPPSPKL